VNPITCNSKPESSVVAISAERPSTLKHIDLIAGARPNFMKIAPIIEALKAAGASGGGALRYRLVHTGQHYDQAMSGSFFEQLGIPAPDVNLEVGSGTQAEQDRRDHGALRRGCLLEQAQRPLPSGGGCHLDHGLFDRRAQMRRVRWAHVEGGIRSGDWTMPEEINRVVTDSITNWFFTTSEVANANLRRSGVTRRSHLLRRQHDDRLPC
jgi:UDP-N-acetylglucosamine 2-epimerase (non-hydrolysing)